MRCSRCAVAYTPEEREHNTRTGRAWWCRACCVEVAEHLKTLRGWCPRCGNPLPADWHKETCIGCMVEAAVAGREVRRG